MRTCSLGLPSGGRLFRAAGPALEAGGRTGAETLRGCADLDPPPDTSKGDTALTHNNLAPLSATERIGCVTTFNQ